MLTISRRLFTVLLICLSTPIALAQKPAVSHDEKPRKTKREPKKAYVEWIKDVDLILTRAEREAWDKLDNDDEREKFIEDFWRSRLFSPVRQSRHSRTHDPNRQQPAHVH